MLAQETQRNASSLGLAGLAGDHGVGGGQAGGGMSEQEQMMMNAAVMGTLAATDMNINNPPAPDEAFVLP